MGKHLWLVSVLMMVFLVSDAGAAGVLVPASQFPNFANGEYMQPNMIYQNSALAVNMDGVYEGDVWANAVYSECPASYPNVDSGVLWLDLCYRNCKASDVTNIAAGATVSGHYYRGSGGHFPINKCVPSECARGYANVDMDFVSEFANATAIAYAGQGGNGQIHQNNVSNSHPIDDPIMVYGEQNNGDWKVVFGDNENDWNRVLIGSSVCASSTTSGLLESPSQEGQGTDCYCWITGYKPKFNDSVYVVDTLRVFLGTESNIFGIEGYSCQNNCAVSCAAAVAQNGYPSTATFKNMLYSYAAVRDKCVQSTYTITYDCGSAGGTTPESQHVMYGYSYIPRTNTCTVPEGHTFAGWIVSNTGDTPDVLKPGTNASTWTEYWEYTENKTFTPKWSADVTCVPGKYVAANTHYCSECPENSYCIGGTFDAPLSVAQGIKACPTGLVSPQGTISSGGCGKIMHVGEDVLYLTSEQQTTPALAVKLEGKVYYAKMTPGAKAINEATNTSLRTRVDGVEYSIHDNTTQEE